MIDWIVNIKYIDENNDNKVTDENIQFDINDNYQMEFGEGFCIKVLKTTFKT